MRHMLVAGVVALSVLVAAGGRREAAAGAAVDPLTIKFAHSGSQTHP